MPDYTDNHLIFTAPTERMAALRAAMAGPSTWPVPVAAGNGHPRAEDRLSAHEILRLTAKFGSPHDVVDAQRRAQHPMGGLPDWMPVSKSCLETLERPDAVLVAETPLSIPRLAPLKDRAEFDRLVPGIETGALWERDPAKEMQYRSGHVGTIAINNDRIGIKHLPYEIEVVQTDHDNGQSQLLMKFLTAWTEIENLGALLATTLAAHDASLAHLFWHENYDAGLFFIDPARDVSIDEAFYDAFVVEEEDEDNPDETYRRFDKDAFYEAVQERIDDEPGARARIV